MIQLDFEARLAEALKDKLSPEEVARAINTGLNRAATGIRAEMVRQLREEVNLKASYLRDNLKIQKSTPDTLAARIIIRKKDIPLIEYVINLSELRAKARVPRDGKRVLIPPHAQYKKGGPVEVFDHAFLIANAGRGGTGGVIVQRKGKGRYPLKAVKGPPLSTHGSRIMEMSGDEMQERVRKEITAAIRGQISRAFQK